MAMPVRNEKDEAVAVVKGRQFRLPTRLRLATVIPDQRREPTAALRLVEKTLQREGAVRKRNFFSHGLTGRKLRPRRVGGDALGKGRRPEQARSGHEQ
jgi:hypothetical protein